MRVVVDYVVDLVDVWDGVLDYVVYLDGFDDWVG